MPYYEYSCNACDKQFEKRVSVNNTEPIECPYCFSLNVIKLISAVPFHLKGSGWYKASAEG